MRIAFLSNKNPQDIHLSSGTTSHIFNALRSRHKVDWLGGGILQGAFWQHQYLGKQEYFYPEEYTDFFSKILSPVINNDVYDAVFIRDYYLGIGLNTKALKIYVADATFQLLPNSLDIENPYYAKLVEDTEQKLFEEMDLLVFSSHGAMDNACTHYGINPEKCCVIDFGSNISDSQNVQTDTETSVSNLLSIVEEVMQKKQQDDDDDFFIPVYAINLREREDRRENLIKQFEGKDEFRLTITDAVKDKNGKLGLWKSITGIVRKALDADEDIIIICEDDHEFTPDYSPDYMVSNIIAASRMKMDMLSGGIGGYGQAVRISDTLYWTDWFWCTQFIILFKPIYRKILDYKFKNGDTADGILSKITLNRAVMFPFISVQRDFGYSDVTETNDKLKGLISDHFIVSQSRLNTIQKVSDHYREKENKTNH